MAFGIMVGNDGVLEAGWQSFRVNQRNFRVAQLPAEYRSEAISAVSESSGMIVK